MDIKEIIGFLLTRKRWWLIPIMIILIILGFIIVVGQTTAVAPFIYAIF